MYIKYYKMAIVMACFNCYGIPNLLVHVQEEANLTCAKVGTSTKNRPLTSNKVKWVIMETPIGKIATK